MALIGKIDEFRDEAENWTPYQERLERFLSQMTFKMINNVL